MKKSSRDRRVQVRAIKRWDLKSDVRVYRLPKEFKRILKRYKLSPQQWKS